MSISSDFVAKIVPVLPSYKSPRSITKELKSVHENQVVKKHIGFIFWSSLDAGSGCYIGHISKDHLHFSLIFFKNFSMTFCQWLSHIHRQVVRLISLWAYPHKNKSVMKCKGWNTNEGLHLISVFLGYLWAGCVLYNKFCLTRYCVFFFHLFSLNMHCEGDSWSSSQEIVPQLRYGTYFLP